jgi:DNA-binding response OmpR family regulator
MKFLLVEDEEVYLLATSKFLKQKGYVCETATDYQEALDKMLVYEYDCIILDLNLPGGNGLSLLKELKKVHPEAAVIIASSNHSTENKIESLLMGSDDYITKPFDFHELEARIHAIIRRRKFQGEQTYDFKEIKIQPSSQIVTVNDQKLILTQTEYNLLVYFISNKNKTLTKESIAENMYGDNMDQADSYEFIYSHIKNLRKKLLKLGSGDYIKAVYGIGYCWTAD